VEESGRIPLDGVAEGRRATVRVVRGGRDAAIRLASMGLVIGSQLEVLQNGEHGPLLVLVRDTRIALGRDQANEILVEEISDDPAG
jgi:ferrous iron transport protein A